MRILLKVEIPVDAGNELAKKGKLGETIHGILKEQKPEAAYFTEMRGNRCGLIVVNLDDPSQIPAIAEPWFIGVNAKVEFHPAMIVDDLVKAAPAIDRAAKKYGSV
jgi:hypothetical protein